MVVKETLESWSRKAAQNIDLYYAISYEPRGIASLQRILAACTVRRAFIFELNVEDYLSGEHLAAWQNERDKVYSALQNRSVNFETFRIRDSDEGTWRRLDAVFYSDGFPLVDITTFPKNYVLRLASLFGATHGQDIAFAYTSSPRHSAPTFEETRIGAERIVPIDGFEGDTYVSGETVLILSLGFEGNRALPFLTEFPAARTIALVGSPGCGLPSPSADDEFYISQARAANRNLLKNSFVEEVIVNSRDPMIFARHLRAVVEGVVAGLPEANVVVVPLGTKAQTLGLYRLWSENRWIQVLYSLPSRRAPIAVEIGETQIFSFSGSPPGEFQIKRPLRNPMTP